MNSLKLLYIVAVFTSIINVSGAFEQSNYFIAESVEDLKKTTQSEHTTLPDTIFETDIKSNAIPAKKERNDFILDYTKAIRQGTRPAFEYENLKETKLKEDSFKFTTDGVHSSSDNIFGF